MLLVIAFISTAIAAYCGMREWRASRKRAKMQKMVSFLQTDLRTGEVIHDALMIGAGATATTIFSVYDAISDHEGVLKVMEQRFPDELDHVTPLEWLNKVEELYQTGDGSVQSYVSNYAGQQAEELAAAGFQNEGLEAQLFESRIHPNDDIRVFENDSYIDYSVKSYSSTEKFMQTVSDHPHSTHYVVNSELFAQLEQKGLLQDYIEKGITIKDGGFENIVLREEASGAFEAIHDSADVATYIPFVGLVLFGIKSSQHTYQFFQGKHSKREYGINVASDAAKVGVATGAGIGGAKLGMFVGTAIMPGIGTILGGGIGAIAATMTSGKIMEYIKSKWKWGAIVKAQLEIGEVFDSSFHPTIYQQIKNKIFCYGEVQERLEKEKNLNVKYKKELDSYHSSEASLAATLSQMYEEFIESHAQRIQRAVKRTELEMKLLSAKAAYQFLEHKSNRELDKIKKIYLGELILSNRSFLFDSKLTEGYSELIHTYEMESKKSPHHPYQFNEDPAKILQGCASTAFQNTSYEQVPYSFLVNKKRVYTRVCWFSISIAILMSLFYAAKKYIIH